MPSNDTCGPLRTQHTSMLGPGGSGKSYTALMLARETVDGADLFIGGLRCEVK